MQINVYGDDKVIHPAMHSENSGCFLYLFTNLTGKFWVNWQNLHDLKLEDNRYAISYFNPFDSDWESGSIFIVYCALE